MWRKKALRAISSPNPCHLKPLLHEVSDTGNWAKACLGLLPYKDLAWISFMTCWGHFLPYGLVCVPRAVLSPRISYCWMFSNGSYEKVVALRFRNMNKGGTLAIENQVFFDLGIHFFLLWFENPSPSKTVLLLWCQLNWKWIQSATALISHDHCSYSLWVHLSKESSEIHYDSIFLLSGVLPSHSKV